MRFIGNIEGKVDQKGRVFLPSVFRRELQSSGEERLVMRMDLHQKCMVLFPESAWNRRMDQLFERADEWDMDERQAVRQYMKDVELLTLDGSGRVLLPARYQQKAEIGQTVRFIGMNDTIEIWAAENANESDMDEARFASTVKNIMARKKE